MIVGGVEGRLLSRRKKRCRDGGGRGMVVLSGERESVCVYVGSREWGLFFLFFSLLFTNKQRASNIVVAFAFIIQRCGDIQTISGIFVEEEEEEGRIEWN